MSILHLPYEEPPYMRQRESNSYDMGLALEMKPSSLLPDPYMFDQLLHPLAPVASSHSMPYDMPSGFAPSHYHLGSAPYDLHGNGDVHHPSPVRPIPSGLGWAETTPRTYYPEHSSAHSYPSTSLSQPSIFVSSASSRSMVPSETASTLDHSAPPPPWTMSGSLDPSTGIYQVAPEHPRIRTAQACEKCRGRKAKCSGEHPSCERCRIRGLKCEYAPERKMRGPNKVKRKTADKSSRRISVASTASEASTMSTISDDSSERPSTPPNVEFQQFTMNLGKASLDSRPSTASSTQSSVDSPPGFSPAQLDGRSRPSHIDLSGTRLADQMNFSYVGEDDTFAYDISSARRASLPARFVDPLPHTAHLRSPSLGQVYTPSRGIDVIDAYVSRPHSNPHQSHLPFGMPPTHGLSNGSGSDMSMSAPITPLSMHSGGELMYPVEYHHDFMDFVGPDLHIDTQGVHTWDNVEHDADVTPRVTTDGHEKSLAQFASQYVHE